MIEYVSGCKGCGMSPCYDCQEVVFTCDSCNKEQDELYELEEEQLCSDCYMQEIFNSFTSKFKKGECISCSDNAILYSLDGDDKYCKSCYRDYIRETMVKVSE